MKFFKDNPNMAGDNPAVTPTRFKNLGYTCFGPRHWQFIYFEGANGPRAQIGCIYPTKDELLADVAAFAKERGFGLCAMRKKGA